VLRWWWERGETGWCCSPRGSARADPIVQPLFDGAVYVAAKYRVPIVPVGIGGSERAMKKGSKFIRPVKVHVEIGPAISTAGRVPPTGRVPRDAVAQISAELREELQALFDQARIRRRGLVRPLSAARAGRPPGRPFAAARGLAAGSVVA